MPKSLIAACNRSFGAPAGDPNHVYKVDQINSVNTAFKQPSEADVKFQMANRIRFNERMQAWIAARWQPDRDFTLDNAKVNKMSAYYWFSTSGLLQNRIVYSLARMFFDQRSRHEDHYTGFQGVTTSENGLFLYKSDQANSYLASRFYDYFLVGTFAAFMFGSQPLMLLPFFASACFLPRKMAHVQYFTYHAELLPHTEQVVFHKAGFFGQVGRHFVDIKNLEKIDAATIPTGLLFTINMFDNEMIFRDNESKQVFVFDRNGYWNKDTLEHPLIH